MGLAAGELDRIVLLERGVGVRDQSGQIVMTWSPIATVWASWRRASARETLAAAELQAAVTDVFVIRYSADVAALDPKCRLTFDGAVYDIAEVTEVGHRDGLRIVASARAD